MVGDRRANDNYGYVLAAQPGQSQGRPTTTAGSKPIVISHGLPYLRSPENPGPGRHERTEPSIGAPRAIVMALQLRATPSRARPCCPGGNQRRLAANHRRLGQTSGPLGGPDSRVLPKSCVDHCDWGTRQPQSSHRRSSKWGLVAPPERSPCSACSRVGLCTTIMTILGRTQHIDSDVAPYRCKCGAGRLQRRHTRPTSAPNAALTWTFLGADDGIRTRDPHLGKHIATGEPQLPYLRLCKSTQRARRLRLTTANRY